MHSHIPPCTHISLRPEEVVTSVTSFVEEEEAGAVPTKPFLEASWRVATTPDATRGSASW